MLILWIHHHPNYIQTPSHHPSISNPSINARIVCCWGTSWGWLRFSMRERHAMGSGEGGEKGGAAFAQNMQKCAKTYRASSSSSSSSRESTCRVRHPTLERQTDWFSNQDNFLILIHKKLQLRSCKSAQNPWGFHYFRYDMF